MSLKNLKSKLKKFGAAKAGNSSKPKARKPTPKAKAVKTKVVSKKPVIKLATEALKTGASGESAKIVIQNSYCTISGFRDEHVETIAEKLTYENVEAAFELQQAKVQIGYAYRFKNFAKVGVLKEKISELEGMLIVCWLKGDQFPTGHLELVKGALKASAVKYELADGRVLSAPQIVYKWATAPKVPRYYQTEMVELGIKHHRGVFSSCVGSGKTLTAQMLIHALQVPVIVVVPSKDLCIQTGDDYTAAFGAKYVDVITSSKSHTSTKPIRICTMHTLTALRKKGELEPLLAGLGMIVVDEAHHNGCKSFCDLLPYFDHIYYRWGFSGSYLRADSKTLDMWGFLSTVLYEYPAHKAIAEGYLTPVEVIVHDIDGQKINGRVKYQTEYTKNYCGNPRLLNKLKEIFEDYGAAGEQVLILVGRKDTSGKIVHEYLKDLGIENVYVDGDSDKEFVKQALQDFNSEKIKVLVGSQVLGEGIDIRSADVLVMLQGGKSIVNITQAVGRLVRLFPGKEKGYLHDFRFLGTKYLISHTKERLSIYRNNFGVDC